MLLRTYFFLVFSFDTFISQAIGYRNKAKHTDEGELLQVLMWPFKMYLKT